MINIAYLDYSHTFAGAEQVLYTIISNLDRTKFNPILIFPYPMPHHNRYHDLDCLKINLNSSVKWWMGSERWQHPLKGTDFATRTIWGIQLVKVLKSNKVSILHVNLLRPDSLMWLLPVKNTSIKVIGHFRSQAIEWIPSPKVQHCCDLVLCVSKYSRSRFLTKGEFTPSRVLYDSIDVNKFHSDLTKEEAKRMLGFSKEVFLISSVGQLARHKGHDNAIKAFHKIAARYPNAVLYIAGGGVDLEYLKHLASEESDISSRILFTEKQVSNIQEIYKASDLVLSLTKVGEAFGLVPYEATLCGTSFIGPDFGAIKEFVEDKKNGILVDTNDVNAIAEQMEWVLNHPEECAKMVDSLAALINRNITPKIMATNLMNVYEHL